MQTLSTILVIAFQILLTIALETNSNKLYQPDNHNENLPSADTSRRSPSATSRRSITVVPLCGCCCCCDHKVVNHHCCHHHIHRHPFVHHHENVVSDIHHNHCPFVEHKVGNWQEDCSLNKIIQHCKQWDRHGNAFTPPPMGVCIHPTWDCNCGGHSCGCGCGGCGGW